MSFNVTKATGGWYGGYGGSKPPAPVTTCHRCGDPKRPFRFCRKCWIAERRRLGLEPDPRNRR